MSPFQQYALRRRYPCHKRCMAPVLAMRLMSYSVSDMGLGGL